MHMAPKMHTGAMTKTVRAAVLVTASLGMFATVMTPVAVTAQAAAAPRQSGTVKAVSGDGLTLTTPAGQDYTVAVGSTATIMNVPAGAKDLASATPGKLSDVAVGDKVIVTGTAGDSGSALTARRVILMKSSAIADLHAAEEAAWAKGGGGIVKSVDAATGTISASSGMKPLTVKTTATTDVKRYANGSVKASDAVKSTVAAIQPGDQIRVRGEKTEDGGTITADAILVGSFRNYSGLITAIDPAAGTVTLKDLATKKPVTVAIGSNADVRRIPAMMATMLAGRLKGGAGGPGAGGPGAGGPGAGAPGAGGPPAGGPPAGGPPAGGPPAGVGAAGGGYGGGGFGGARPRNMDLGQMLSRLPTETLAGLKSGEAVMIVAMPPASGTGASSAVTLLAGVEPLLEASPSGAGMTLTPWSLGGDGGAGAMSGGMPQ